MQEISGVRSYYPVRTSAVLTGSYVAGTVLKVAAQFNELVLYCLYTKGSLDSLQIKVESSLDGTNWVQETNVAISGATGTMNVGEFSTTDNANFKITIPMTANQVRVSAKGTGTVTSSLLQIDAMLAYV